MIIKIGTSYSPDTLGIERYDKKVELFAKELTQLIPNSSIYSRVITEISECSGKTIIVLSKDLKARRNVTKDKQMLCYFMMQARKAKVAFILIVPEWSTVSYLDERIDRMVDVCIVYEFQAIELIKLFSRKE